MRMFANFLFLVLFLLAASCSKDPVQKGDEAFQNDELLDAQNYYEKALKRDPKNDKLKEKLLITYFRTGKTFYETRRLVSSFEGQVKQGFAFLPEVVSDSLKGMIANTLLELAQAFRSAPAENDFQRKEYTQKAALYLNTALEYDSTNTAVIQELQEIENKQIANIIKKGQAYLKAGDKNPENYFIAEEHFLKALAQEPDNREAINNLATTRKKLLPIFDYSQFTPIAVLKRSTIGELLVFEIKIMNNTNRAMDLKGDGFYLIASDNTKTQGFFSEEFSMPYITITLASRQEAKGVVSFDAPPNKRYVKLEYKGEGKFEGFKYLP